MLDVHNGSDGVDVWMLRELGCRGLICCLEEVPGKKDLIIDSSLMKMLDRLAQAATLRYLFNCICFFNLLLGFILINFCIYFTSLVNHGLESLNIATGYTRLLDEKQYQICNSNN